MGDNGVIEAFRKAMVEVLVPEIRQIHTDMQDLRKEMNERFAAQSKETNERFAAQSKETNERFAKMDDRFAAIKEDMTTVKIQLTGIDRRLDYAERLYKMEENIAFLLKQLGNPKK